MCMVVTCEGSDDERNTDKNSLVQGVEDPQDNN